MVLLFLVFFKDIAFFKVSSCIKLYISIFLEVDIREIPIVKVFKTKDGMQYVFFGIVFVTASLVTEL